MLPVLPRELLWNDRKSMDEFFGMEPVNEDFFEVLQALREEPFLVKVDATKVFNEVYYQLTRMMYEHALPADLPKYTADIKANMGWNYSAELVLTMVYFIISIIPRPKHPVNKFFVYEIKKKTEGSLYWKLFDKLYYQLKKDRKQLLRPFRPTPIPAKELQALGYVNWNLITHHYELSCIDHVVNLWESREDREIVARMILDSCYSLNGNDGNDYEQMQRYLRQYVKAEKKEPDKDEAITAKEVEIRKGNERALQVRIKELEAENESLRTLLDNKKKAVGKDRKFTLVQIVDYCKNCVAWDDAKSVVAMLNKLLRVGATQEDSDLVDSIEAEFRRRLTGNTIHNTQMTINNQQIHGQLYDVVQNNYNAPIEAVYND